MRNSRFVYDDGNKRRNNGIRDTLFFRTEIFQGGKLIFHSISKENEERKLAPMSINGVKFITGVASCLAIFDRKPRTPAVNTEFEPAEEPETPPPASERPALRVYPKRCIARARPTLGIA